MPPQGGPPPTQQYPPRDQPSRIAAGKQPAPQHPSSPPPQQAYQPYTQASHLGGQRPQSTYGNPQELATPAYDSPVATHNNASAPDPYSASAYSQDDMYSSPTAPAPSASPPGPLGPPQGVPMPLALASHSGQPQYTAYNPNPRPLQHQASFDTPSQHAPPQPTGAAPLIPQGQVADGVTPLPLQPGGPHYDSRHSLPSQQAQQPQQPQYKAYVPPGASNEPSAPQDYYRQGTTY